MIQPTGIIITYEACCLFIVKAVCFGQIRTSPIVFQVRYVLGVDAISWYPSAFFHGFLVGSYKTI